MKIITLFIVLLSSYTCLAQQTYFVDFTNGNDSNSGLSTSNAWKTISKVNASVFSPGDSILFKRGEEWRDQLLPKSGSNLANVYYGAYGSGNKPKILGSHNKNAATDWVNVSGNYWKCTTTYPIDIGNIIFDQEASVGMKKWQLSELLQQDDFYYDKISDEVVIYSTQNPAIIHSTIELAIRRHVIDHSNCSYVTFENLDLRYGAAHGFGGSSTSFLTVRHCDLSYIGGGDLAMNGDNVRYGNAIEYWGNAHDNCVEYCKIDQIYDTGLTNQNHTDIKSQYNIFYRFNVISNCGMAALEVWNRPAASSTHNIQFTNNTCFNLGYGWGSQRTDYSGAGVAFWHNEAQQDSVIIRNNIFQNAQRTTYFIEDASGANGKIIDHNLVYNPNLQDTVFWKYGVQVFTGNTFGNFQTTTGFDTGGIYGDALFLDAANLDLHLTELSPAVNNGLYNGELTDFDGISLPQGSTIDMGALEFVVTHLPELSKQSLVIYPNPTTGICNAITDRENQQFCLIDPLGRLLIEFEPGINGFDISTLASGNYYIVNKNDPSTKALLIKK